jgi:N-acetylmuramoyl-L-alanine amidase
MQEEFLDQSVALATMIQDNFSNSLKRTDRKVKQAGFIVLHQTFMPSVLVETGFLTNKEEGAYLNSSKGQNEMGNAIAKAILHYKEGVQPTVNSVANNVVKPKAQPVKEEIVKKVEEKKNDAKEIVTVVKKQDPIIDNTVKEEVKLPVIDDKTKEAINPKEVANSIVFKIQIMATSKNVPLNPSNFKGLSNLSQEPFKNLYRYMYGETRSYREAEMMQSLARDKGYATAYIVAYKLGERIPIKDAMDEVSEFTP